MRRRLVLAAVPAALAGCSVVDAAKLVAPERFGLQAAAPDLYVEAAADAALRARLRDAREQAHVVIARAYGDVLSRPVVHACVTEDCYARFGGRGSIAKVYGERILLSPRGLDWHFIAHEWSHDEIRERLGVRAWLRLPAWFDEGLAAAISEAPEHSEAHYQSLVAAGVPLPTPEQLHRMRSLREWLEGVDRWGDSGNARRRAAGVPELRPLYAAAAHEVRPWLERTGTAGVQDVIALLRAGEAFDAEWLAAR